MNQEENRVRLQIKGYRAEIRNIFAKINKRGFPTTAEMKKIKELQRHIRCLESGEPF